MRDGQQCSIKLLSSHTQQDVTYYQLQLSLTANTHILNYRFSQLFKLSQLLPQVTIPFPQKEYFKTLINRLVGHDQFLRKRHQELNNYFQAVSQQKDLVLSQGIKDILQEINATTKEAERNDESPMAPKLKGKKLNKKAIENTQFILCD